MDTTTPASMTPLRPFLVRGLLDWIKSNGMRPYVLVDATQPGVQVPAGAVKEGRITLNLADNAVDRLILEHDTLRFFTRFGGVEYPVVLPLASVVAVYAHETGIGMNLPPENVPPSGPPDPPSPPKDKRSHLRVVK